MIQLSKYHPIFTSLGWRKIGIDVFEKSVKNSCLDCNATVIANGKIKGVGKIKKGDRILGVNGEEYRVVKKIGREKISSGKGRKDGKK